MGRLDLTAIDEVRAEAWPAAGSPDECHDALLILGGVTESEARAGGWLPLLAQLAAAGRAARFEVGGAGLWSAAERAVLWRAAHPAIRFSPALPALCRGRAPIAAAALV